MMQYCNECKQAFDEPSVKREWVGDSVRGGRVEFAECPNCGSDDFETALICPECGEFCGELFGDGKKKIMCDACIKKLATEESLIEYGYEDKQSVEINGYLAEMFSPSEIESLLEYELKTRNEISILRCKDENLRKEYIEDCKDNLAIYFAEKLQAKGGKK